MSAFIPVPKKDNAKNVQTIIQLCLFHMQARLCSKSFKLGFSSTWVDNLKMYKLDLKKSEEPEIKLPTSVGSLESKEIPEKYLLCFTDYTKAFGCVDQ